MAMFIVDFVYYAFLVEEKKSVMHLVFYHHFRDKPVLFFSSLLYENKMAWNVQLLEMCRQLVFLLCIFLHTIVDSVVWNY